MISDFYDCDLCTDNRGACGRTGLYILYEFHERILHRPTAGFGAGRHMPECFFSTVQISTVQGCCDMSTESHEGFELRWWANIEDRETTIRQGPRRLLKTGSFECEAQRVDSLIAEPHYQWPTYFEVSQR